MLHQVGEHVGVADFAGLGQLTPEQIAATPSITLSPDAIELGTAAWEALTAPNPLRLLEIESSAELRFLREAFVRLAQDHPWTRDGLSLSERRLLAAVPGTKRELFERASRKEARRFMGDLFAFAMVDRMVPYCAAKEPSTASTTLVNACSPVKRTSFVSTASIAGWAVCTCADARWRGGGTTRARRWSPGSAQPAGGGGGAPGAGGGACAGAARMNGTVAERRLPSCTTRL